MPTRDLEQLARFLTDHQEAIAGLLECVYAEVGGHYAALTPEQQHAQAHLDSRQLITDLLRGGPDRQAIQRTVQTAADPSIPGDIVRLAAFMERRFEAFVRAQLADDPDLARLLLARCDVVFARFRLGLSAAQIDHKAPAPGMKRET